MNEIQMLIDETFDKLSGKEWEFGITISDCAKYKLNIRKGYETME